MRNLPENTHPDTEPNQETNAPECISWENALKSRRASHSESLLGVVGLFFSASLSMVFGILFFLLPGIWLDVRFGTQPVFLIIGVTMGLAAGVCAAYFRIRKYLLSLDSPTTAPSKGSRNHAD